MPAKRDASMPDLNAEWPMLASGFGLALAGLWALNQASPAWQVFGLILLVGGLSAGLRGLVGLTRISRHLKALLREKDQDLQTLRQPARSAHLSRTGT